MTVELEDTPATNGNGEAPSKRISSFKRAIAQLVGLSPENDEGDLVTAVRAKVTVANQAEDVYGKAEESEAKLKALKKKLLLMVAEDLIG